MSRWAVEGHLLVLLLHILREHHYSVVLSSFLIFIHSSSHLFISLPFTPLLSSVLVSSLLFSCPLICSHLTSSHLTSPHPISSSSILKHLKITRRGAAFSLLCSDSWRKGTSRVCSFYWTTEQTEGCRTRSVRRHAEICAVLHWRGLMYHSKVCLISQIKKTCKMSYTEKRVKLHWRWQFARYWCVQNNMIYLIFIYTVHIV